MLMYNLISITRIIIRQCGQLYIIATISFERGVGFFGGGIYKLITPSEILWSP